MSKVALRVGITANRHKATVASAAPKMVVRPTLSGTGRPGQTLTCSAGTFLSGGTNTYQWYLQGVAIAGATSSTYVPQATQSRKHVACDVTCTNTYGSQTVRTFPIEIGNATPRTVVDWSIDSALSWQPWDWSLPYPNQNDVTNGRVFDIGPGQTYEEPHDFNWFSLLPGDTVRIHWRATPYNQIVLLQALGEPNRWIKIVGVPNANGDRPVFDGDGAIMPPANSGINSWTDGSGMFILVKPTTGVSNVAGKYKPGYIWITGLKFVNVNGQHTVKLTGATTFTNWDQAVAAIYLAGIYRVAISNCYFDSNAWHIFCNSTNGDYFQSYGLHIFNNYFVNGGEPNRASEHNCYTEGIGTIYEYNYFDSVLVTSDGDNIKERSAGVIFRYNRIKNGENLISFRDPQSNGAYEATFNDFTGQSLSAMVAVYGNTFFVNRKNYYGSSPAFIAHGDGVMGDGLQVRYGNIHFVKNRVVDFMDLDAPYHVNNTPLFILVNTRATTTVVAKANLFYSRPATLAGTPTPFAIFLWHGSAAWDNNWISPSFVTVGTSSSEEPLAPGSGFDGSGLGGLTASSADPGFANLDNEDLSLTTSSPFYGLTYTPHAEMTTRGLYVDEEPIEYPYNVIPLPSCVTLPVLSGNPVAGNTLSISYGSWSGSPTGYQVNWLLDGVSVGSGTTYTSSATDVGKTLYGIVTATNGTGSTQAASQSIVIASATQPVCTSLPVITGTPSQGQTLTVSTGSWTNSPTSYTYQWQRAGVSISSATTNQYVLTAADVGKAITVQVVAHTATEFGTAVSAAIIAEAPSQDPDSNGVFNFAKPDGTLLSTISGWSANANLYQMIGGTLQTVSGSPAWSDNDIWYTNSSTAANQRSAVRIEAGAWMSGTEVDLAVHQTDTQGWKVLITNSSIEFRIKNTSGGWDWAGKVTVSISNTAANVLDFSNNGTTLTVKNNNTTVATFSASSALSGGYSGLAINPGGTPSNLAISSWTYTSAAL